MTGVLTGVAGLLLAALAPFGPGPRPGALAEPGAAGDQVLRAGLALADSLPVCGEALFGPQELLAGPYADFVRAAELTGAAPLRPHLIRRPATERPPRLCPNPGSMGWESRVRPGEPRRPAGSWWSWLTAPPSLELFPLHLRTEYNSAYPDSRNNGALWAGRGLSTAVSTGLTLRWGPFSAGFAPQLLYHQNREFETAPPPPPGRPLHGGRWFRGKIDWPYRFGEDPFRARDLGQSYLRLDLFGVGLGLSNENLWWGPAIRYPLLMSNTAPGFPHAFLGTSRPLETPVGDFEAQLVWGRLADSDYFNIKIANDGRLLASVVLDYQPRWLPGLYLGAARSYQRYLPAEGLSFRDWSLGPYHEMRENPMGDAADDQLFSLFARWAFPQVGFEAYLEWGRNDHWGEFKDLVREPDHSQAYTLGFQKVSPAGANWLRIYGELARLQASLPQYNTRGLESIYTHSGIRHGYTHRGQLLGAGIGPGSNAQLLGADLFTAGGRIGLYGERIHHDADTHYEVWSESFGKAGQDVEWIAGARQLLFLGAFDLSWDAAYAFRRNRDFLGLYGPDPAVRRERNWHLQLGVSWHPR